jgi:cytoskeleton protein RodZ
MSEPHASEGAMPAEAGAPSAGALLRRARQAQGLHIAALAASLKVTPRKLEALEADRHDELLDATFVRALAQAVCRALKIDAEPVLARLPTTTVGGGLEPMTAGLNAPVRARIGSRRDTGDWPRLSRPLLWGALALAGAAVLLYLLPSGLLRRQPAGVVPEGAASAPEALASAPNVAADDAGAPVNMPPPAGVVTVPDAGASGQSQPLASPPLATPLSVPEAAASQPVEAPVPAPGDAAPLSLRTSGEAWIEIRQAGGKVLLSRTVKAGEALDFDAVPPVLVKVGNTAVTELRYRGEVVPFSRAAGNVARLELK